MKGWSEKRRSILLIVAGQVSAMSLWFISAAVLPDMLREAPIAPWSQALLSSAVQAGFVVGALASAVLGIADRFDPRRVLALSALLAALANLGLLVAPIGGPAAILLRFVTGVLFAGVYPVGMKLAVGWGQRDRGFLVGLLIGALTFGSASPHLVAWFGGAEWRVAVIATSAAAAIGGGLVLAAGLGPYHAKAPGFDPSALRLAWTDRRIRFAFGGYLGHMWELYAMWAWIGAAVAASYATRMSTGDAAELGKLTAFATIGLGGIASIVAGRVADRIGKAEVAMIALAGSAVSALAVAAAFAGPPWLVFLLAVAWGVFIVPDSAQFSALVADAAPPAAAGSLLAFQTALGFALTVGTVQIVPVAAALVGWPTMLGLLAIGPALGLVSMQRCRHAWRGQAALARPA